MAAAATAEASRSGASAGDSYLGSLISLTSKYEIRYEGLLYNINTQESSIGLKNVRSFGTEGRKKDGPQIPASEKIYEYILFRGNDIKDLQVKASPPVQSAPIHNDPAIIQSHYSRPPPTSTSFPSAGSDSGPDLSSQNAPDLTSHTAYLGLPRPPFQGNMSLYHPSGNLGSWGSSPAPPTANGPGLAVPPIYWQGYYAPTGAFSHLQQPPLMRPPPGLAIPQSMQQPLQYPGLSSTLPSGSQNLQELPSPLLPTFSSTLGSTSATIVPSTLAPLQASLLAPEVPSSHMPTKPTMTSLPAATVGANLSFVPQFSSTSEPIASLSQNMPARVSSNPSLVPVPSVSYQTLSQPASSLIGSSTSSQFEKSVGNASFLPQIPSSISESAAAASQHLPTSIGSNPSVVPISNVNYQAVIQSVPSAAGSSNTRRVETPVPLVTPDQLLQPTPSVVSSSRPLQTSPIGVEVKRQEAKIKPQEAKIRPLLPEPSVRAPAETKEPILPLPTPTRQKPNGAVLHTHEISRGRGSGRGSGRGRGNGYPRPMTKFTEDFDFTAMNEKFNKDEVWGHLGKIKSQVADTEGDTEEVDEIPDEDSDEPSKSDSKPIYVKDDFFDTLSCDSLDRGSRNGHGRPRFSEQLKIDAETFGDFSRNRPFRGGGRGFRGGRTRGSYSGRGYGHGGRGRGQSGPYRPF